MVIEHVVLRFLIGCWLFSRALSYADMGQGTTACGCANRTMKTWYLVPWPSPRKRGPRYEATPRLVSYLGPLFHDVGLGMKYQVFMVWLVYVHAVVPRPFSVYERVWGRGYGSLAVSRCRQCGAWVPVVAWLASEHDSPQLAIKQSPSSVQMLSHTTWDYINMKSLGLVRERVDRN